MFLKTAKDLDLRIREEDDDLFKNICFCTGTN